MPDDLTLNPSTMIDPLIRLWAWIAQLFAAPQTFRIVDESLNPIPGVALVDEESGLRGRTKPLTGTGKCRGITYLSCFTESGDPLLLWDGHTEDWVRSLRISAAACRCTVKAKAL